MTDVTYSLIISAGLISGPASAFIVDYRTLTVFALFPVLALMTPARKGMFRISALLTAPVLVLAWGLLQDNAPMVERALRWSAALIAGASMSGALGASRASQLLHSISRRIRLGGLTESLAMAISLVGPYSRRILDVFRTCRKDGMNLLDSFSRSLSSVGGMELTEEAVPTGRSVISLLSACAAWFLMLGGIVDAF